MTEWARSLLLTMRRWLPKRTIVAVMDGEFAALELLHALRPLNGGYYADAQGCASVRSTVQ